MKEQDTIEINVIQLLKALWAKKLLILLVAIVAGAASYAYSSFLVEPEYRGTYLVKDYREIILSQDVLEKVVSDLGLTINAKTLAKKVQVTVPADTRIVSISVSDHKPDEASRIANALREVAAQKIIAVTRVSDVTTLEEARPATGPSSPNIRRNTMMGVGAGAGLVIVVILLVELLDDRVKRPEDVEDVMNISLLGVVPNLDKLK